jgi:protein-S-isoprenylcysteine O-methyltransferase Ste14
MLLRHAVSIFALPVLVVIIMPALLVSLFPFAFLWSFQFSTALSLLIAGGFLTGIGFVLQFSTIKLFIKKGEGTIAPWDPARKLIINGFYSHVRNPMHIGVFLILIGESILVCSFFLTLWTLLFIAGNVIYIPLIEEQKLAERFGDKYLIYKKNVPRWIPRLSSWKPNRQTLNLSNKA